MKHFCLNLTLLLLSATTFAQELPQYPEANKVNHSRVAYGKALAIELDRLGLNSCDDDLNVATYPGFQWALSNVLKENASALDWYLLPGQQPLLIARYDHGNYLFEIQFTTNADYRQLIRVTNLLYEAPWADFNEGTLAEPKIIKKQLGKLLYVQNCYQKLRVQP